MRLGAVFFLPVKFYYDLRVVASVLRDWHCGLQGSSAPSVCCGLVVPRRCSAAHSNGIIIRKGFVLGWVLFCFIYSFLSFSFPPPPTTPMRSSQVVHSHSPNYLQSAFVCCWVLWMEQSGAPFSSSPGQRHGGRTSKKPQVVLLTLMIKL